MKRNKWQRLAAIGLCSSMLVNAFSGVTAVAETVTIESSPTAESSTKEETPASSVKEETTKASTENSQVTTDTSQEEVEQTEKTEIIQEENILEPSSVQAKIMPRAFVWAATGTTNKTTVRLNDVVDYRLKFENITTDDTNSDIVGPIRIESKLAAGMTRPTSVIIKVGPEEQNVVLGEGSHNANSGGEYFVWTESTRTVTAFINRLHGRTSGNTGYIKTLYFQTRITSGIHNEKKYIDSTIRFNGFGAVNRRNEMTYVDKFAGNLGLKGSLKFYDEDGQSSKEQMSLSMNPVLFKSTNSKVEGTLLRYPLTMTNAGNGLYSFNTGLKTVGTSNGGSWLFFSNDIAINFATATTNRIDKIVLTPPKTTFPDSRTGVMTSRAYTSTTYTRSNYDISAYNFTKATGKTWRITNLNPHSGVSTNIMFSDNLVGTTGQFNAGNNSATITYYIYYKKLYENFVNSSGQKIAPPPGFTQGKKTVINSEAYTFKQAGTLPDTYTTGGKTYKFKGWYKGKTKPSTLTTTKAPSYAVTYDGNDDLNVVYEEVKTKTYTLPSKEITFGYVDEKGNLINPANFILKATMSETEKSGTTTPFSTITGTNVTTTNLKKLTIPQKVYTLPESAESITYITYGTQSVTHEIPKYYRTISISPTATYTGDKTKYPLANEVRKEVANPSTVVNSTTGTNAYELVKTNNTLYNTKQYYWTWDATKTLYAMSVYSGNVGANYNLATPDKTVYYYLENRRVTENFVDTNGAKITAPTGFTQGKKTVITSDAYTFKQAGTLPDTYKVGTKTYKFKGWYKGKTKPSALTTTKAPSYAVTYDDNDDLNVVYEELIPKDTWVYPGFHAEFVDEKGQAFNEPLTFSGNYTQTLRKAVDQTYVTTGAMNPLVSIKNTNKANIYTITTQSRVNVPANFDEVPSAIYDMRTYAINDWNITTELKYIDKIETMNTTLPVSEYPVGFVGTDPVFNNSGPGQLNEIDKSFKKGVDNKFSIKATFGVGSSVNTVPRLLLVARATGNPENKIVLHGFDGTQDFKQTMNYKVTRKQVTENFVDVNGAKITPPTGFTQGNQIPMTSNTFKYTAAKALPATYTAGGKTYTFQGWYKGKTKPSTLNKTTTPTFNATFDGNDDMTAMYKEEIPTASVTLTRPKEVIDTNTNVIWTTTITNTSKAPLQNLNLKKGPNWSAGLTIPTFMEVTPEGETTKSIPVNSTLWTEGVSLPNAVPIGKKVSIAFTTRATGKPNTVLKAEVVVFGGIKDSTVDNFVRIRPNDQEVVTPTTEGFISVPTFDFGQVGVAGSKQQHNLKKAADYYGNGTRNPYVRIKKTQPNWSLTAQLSQPKSATDSLPTATRLLLGAAPVSSFTNYNQPTELKNAVGTTSAISLTANNTATDIIANQQFTGSNVYQLDFTFNNVKLEVPANQGVKGQQYKAAVTWNLVTGP
ncbi:WxL domain-containing protein [Enterococcus faecalis]|uniref:WxL domain-containing protein n=1 Tax=Enterococcus TaxID=1350 RepID=UPI000DFF1921|nr:WxL domain-containing protein [Enterococcus faecalis]EHL2448723.1 WxL domain-containing protein [Enterococcus faecalis]EHU5024705.1 WxL domain-containing protein [Enterococcus faecalis]EIP8107316.1 WxL domain-containing protein [Enterococcus faecalis]EJC3087189.1 WxL domain-containing protein [Enterococcus faecalis]EKG2072303.1 WxL domain-containing protein [Enterococcus faecalis]